MKSQTNISGKDLNELRTFQLARPLKDILWNCWVAIAAAQTLFAIRPSVATAIFAAAIIGMHHR